MACAGWKEGEMWASGEDISGRGSAGEWDSQRGRARERDNVSLIKKSLRTVVNEGRVQGAGCR